MELTEDVGQMQQQNDKYFFVINLYQNWQKLESTESDQWGFMSPYQSEVSENKKLSDRQRNYFGCTIGKLKSASFVVVFINVPIDEIKSHVKLLAPSLRSSKKPKCIRISLNHFNIIQNWTFERDRLKYLLHLDKNYCSRRTHHRMQCSDGVSNAWASSLDFEVTCP